MDCDNLGIGLWKRGKVVHLFVLQFIEVCFRSRMKTNKALTAIRTASLHSNHGECYFSLMISNSIACSFWLIRSYLAYISQVEQCFSLIPNQPAVLSAMAQTSFGMLYHTRRVMFRWLRSRRRKTQVLSLQLLPLNCSFQLAFDGASSKVTKKTKVAQRAPPNISLNPRQLLPSVYVH